MKVKMWFYKTSTNGVSVKVNLGTEDNGYRFYKGMGRSIRRNKQKDKEEYPLIVSYGQLEKFMSVNNISDGDVTVDERSIETFYGFSDYNGKFFASVDLKEKFVDEWWNYDCPHVYRYSVNKDNHANVFGLKFLVFQNMICEASWSSTHIGEDITLEEVRKFTKGRENSHIRKEMDKVLESRSVTEEQIKEMKEFVEDYEEKVQLYIDMFAGEIEASVENIDQKNLGPDFGDVNIHTRNEGYNERKKVLKNIDSKYKDYLDVNLPVDSPFVTIQRLQFEKFKECVPPIGKELYTTSRLD